jgi:predicted RNA-binding Zn-ribbon protein involved in translation (DUF1610 family)
MSSEGGLVLLLECGGAVEAASVRGLLETEGIEYVVQGEHHASMVGGPFGNPAVLPRVLVAQRDLEAARQLLAAKPVLEGTAPEDGASLEGSLCPVHEQAAVATCGQCGTLLCATCNSLGNPPLCEDCLARDSRPPPVRSGLSVAMPFIAIAVLVVLVLFARAYGLL